jgi:hypothetical protein
MIYDANFSSTNCEWEKKVAEKFNQCYPLMSREREKIDNSCWKIDFASEDI